MCGINTRYHNAGITVKDNIEAGANELANDLIKSKGNYIRAVWLYKGKTPLGLRQANHVKSIYENIKRMTR
jgi:hypothetical protein